jgi:nicotinamide-nucleotide amidase
MNQPLYALAKKLGERLQESGWWLATAEACTGGWVAKAITDVAGSSAWFDRGFVTYTNAAKQEMLGVSAATLERYGAVSEETAREMASGALQRSHAKVALAISGIAGPSGGTPDKPVGSVCFAWAYRNGRLVSRHRRFAGDREAVRLQAVREALLGVFEEINERD